MRAVSGARVRWIRLTATAMTCGTQYRHREQISPELVLVDPKLARERSNASDRIEREGTEFHRTVDRAYRSLAEMFPNRITPVDGNRPPRAVAEEIVGRVRDLS